jgi:hypothetical protein
MSRDKDSEFLAALNNFKAPQLAATKGAANIDVCATYNQVKPILAGVLPFIKLIPVIGSKAYTALSALKTVLDALCPSAAAS